MRDFRHRNPDLQRLPNENNRKVSFLTQPDRVRINHGTPRGSRGWPTGRLVQSDQRLTGIF